MGLKDKRTLRYLLASGLTGVLLWAGWPPLPLAFLLFIGFVPLLWVEDKLFQSGGPKTALKVFLYAYLAFFLWNILTTWWVSMASAAGATFMLLANSLLMSLVFLLFHKTRVWGGNTMGYMSLLFYWMTFEWVHLNWDVSWPWLNLGNGLSCFPSWIQWYEYTGAFGGTLWILVANLSLAMLLFRNLGRQRRFFLMRSIAILVIWIFGPIIGSVVSYYQHESRGEPVNITVMQPNIDPYTQKFVGTENFIPFEQQLERFISLSKKKTGPKTDFLLWPESALDVSYQEGRIRQYNLMKRILTFKSNYPDLGLLTGLTTYKVFEDSTKLPPAGRYNSQVGHHVAYNTAMFIKDTSDVRFYHKSKLVPGVEIMPYPGALNFLIEIVFNLGGTTGGFGRQDERTVFYNKDSIGMAPAICYESIYGEYMGQYIRNGASWIAVITNDGWWSDTPGYKQHMHYAVPRAIELRKGIARCANTGISCFINQRGDIRKKTEFWTQTAIKGEIKANERLTFYARHGDYLARIAMLLTFVTLPGALVKNTTKRKKKKKHGSGRTVQSGN